MHCLADEWTVEWMFTPHLSFENLPTKEDFESRFDLRLISLMMYRRKAPQGKQYVLLCLLCVYAIVLSSFSALFLSLCFILFCFPLSVSMGDLSLSIVWHVNAALQYADFVYTVY